MENKSNRNRVELHCHTGYSKDDGIGSVKDIIDFAVGEGMTSLAFTDQGCVSAYPDIQYYCEGMEGFKPIYGIEGYVVNDIDMAGENLDEVASSGIDTDVVVFDLETTGFLSDRNEIIEIGAVKIRNGKITEEFHTFVRPSKPIPEKISSLTGITDDMVKDADPIDIVMPDFIRFAGDSILVAHNVFFDSSFVKAALSKLNITYRYRAIDTLVLSRLLLPDVKRHTLDSIADAYGVSLENHHRAIVDARATAEIYLKMVDELKGRGINTIGDVTNLISKDESVIRNSRTSHVTILAKNKAGIRAIYKLVSDSNIKYYNMRPRIRLSELLSERDNLLLGSACSEGTLYEAIIDGKQEEYIEQTASMYDFLEIQSSCENTWMINAVSIDDVTEINKRIVRLGEKLNILVVATSDVHYLRPENAISRSVLKEHLGYLGAKDDDHLYFRTTEEMLSEFKYLDNDKAYEIVVENTNKIADQIEYVKPIENVILGYNESGDFEKLEEICFEGLKKIYGPDTTIDNVAADVKDRLLSELSLIKEMGSAYYYLWFYELLNRNNVNIAQYNLRGCGAGMLVNYLLGISHVNPLDTEVPLYSEFFTGINGSKLPDIDMNVDSVIWAQMMESTMTLPNVKTAYRASTLSTYSEADAYSMINDYEPTDRRMTEDEKDIVVRDLKSVVNGRHLHPGAMIMIPKDADETIYSPVDMDDDREIKTLHFRYYSVDHIFNKLDIISHETCSLNARLYEKTGYYPTDTDIRSDEIISLFSKPASEMKVLFKDVPSFGNEFMISLIERLKSTTYAELVKLKAMFHGTNTWLENGEVLFAEGKVGLRDMIATREDVYEMMLSCGIDRNTAFAIAENIRKGKMALGRMKPELKDVMISAGVPDWYIWSCEQVRYLFPRAHAAEYVQMELRSLYYKMKYPEMYDEAYKEVYGDAP